MSVCLLRVKPGTYVDGCMITSINTLGADQSFDLPPRVVVWAKPNFSEIVFFTEEMNSLAWAEFLAEEVRILSLRKNRKADARQVSKCKCRWE